MQEARSTKTAESDVAATPKSRWFASNGLKLHCLEWGSSDAEPVVLLHGGFDHAHAWDHVAIALSKDYRLLVPDLRGHGDSAWSGGGAYGLDDHVEDLGALLRATGLAATRIVAHSYGGRVAMRFAAVYPDMVDRLAVIEGLGPPLAIRTAQRATPIAHRIRAFHERRAEISLRPRRRLRTWEDCLSRIWERNPRLTIETVWHLAAHGTRREGDGTFIWKFDPLVGPMQPLDVSEEEAIELFASIRCPTLLVHGRESASAPPENDARVAALSDVRTQWIDGAGHWVQHDQPAELLRTVASFLA